MRDGAFLFEWRGSSLKKVMNPLNLVESSLNTGGESLKKVEPPLNTRGESLKKVESSLNRFHFPSSILSFTKNEGVSKICQRILN
ncbi:hypothetical protein ADM90_18770 [Lysinibacillus macroides]|uniref:Uncharacterized protein n=1 Tax=Lysinibacillus macroides TaxID=33935 RepID=A0A0M9DHV3_9BACI|nr:hypothetical protein ADM90_18770 [Lysinibacillus macroides]